MRREGQQRLTRTPILQQRLRLPVLVALYCLLYWAVLLLRPGSHRAVVTIDDGLGLLGTLIGSSLALRA